MDDYTFEPKMTLSDTLNNTDIDIFWNPQTHNIYFAYKKVSGKNILLSQALRINKLRSYANKNPFYIFFINSQNGTRYILTSEEFLEIHDISLTTGIESPITSSRLPR